MVLSRQVKRQEGDVPFVVFGRIYHFSGRRIGDIVQGQVHMARQRLCKLDTHTFEFSTLGVFPCKGDISEIDGDTQRCAGR